MATQTLTRTETSALIVRMLTCPDCEGEGCPECEGFPVAKATTHARPVRDDSATVRAVMLPTGVVGFRVGGMTFARHEAAARYAGRRAAKVAAYNAHLNEMYERSVEVN